jgi:RNA polymerase sigma-70 factor (ECF subfamily)
MRPASAAKSDDRATRPSSSALDPLRASGVRSGECPALDDDEIAIASLLLSGDARGAIARAARVHGPGIGRLCYLLLGSQGEADEAAQETFVAAFHAASSYRGEGSARAWLFTIARRTCAQRLEVRTRQARRRELLRAVTLEHEDASTLHEEAERAAALRVGLASLAPADREILALRFEADLPFKEIARSLGIDEATARKRASRALARLRDALGRADDEGPDDPEASP